MVLKREADRAPFGMRLNVKQHDPAPLGAGSLLEAGDRGRTDDIHVGNVTLYH